MINLITLLNEITGEDNNSFFKTNIDSIKKIISEILPTFDYYINDQDDRIVISTGKYDTDRNLIEIAAANKYYGYEGANNELYVYLYNKKEISSISLADPKAAYQTTSARQVKHKKTKITKTINSLENLKKILIAFKKKIS
jgi:hypothetical protein